MSNGIERAEWFRVCQDFMKELTRLVEYNLIVILVHETLLARAYVLVGREQFEQMKYG